MWERGQGEGGMEGRRQMWERGQGEGGMEGEGQTRSKMRESDGERRKEGGGK
jgi:hypothetical protein